MANGDFAAAENGVATSSSEADEPQQTADDGPRRSITVHPFTDDPPHAWADLQRRHGLRSEPVQPHTLVDESTSPEDRVRVVCISDTHSRLNSCLDRIPAGDVLVHAGDFTFMGRSKEVREFNEALSTLPHPHKLVIAGNHELNFDPSCRKMRNRERNEEGPERLLTACTYLCDSSVTLFGYKFYGSPWQPRHLDWAFNVNRGEALLRLWNRIPDDTDILITHGPPLGHGDRVHNYDEGRVGCTELLQTVTWRVRPLFHVFGHIHEGYGVTTDGRTKFVNASVCDVRYKPVNEPIVFDLPRIRRR